MDKAKKEQLVAELHEKLQRASAAVLTDFKGLTVAEITALRDNLAEQGVEYRVVKNTLMRIAAKGTTAEVVEPLLTGTNAVAISYEDPSALAKALKNFAKETDKFQIKGGVLGSNPLSPQDVEALAELPSREEMLATFLGTLNAVPTGLVRVLSGVPRAFVGVLAAIEREKEQAS
ncbi:LSU ribosomal protein L10P [Desulfacinum hydrothermale DSM 13146]|uniref:Large ribosomal subunit protein uL10 n=1 Tax=Desulfacinum hydrothermale DSM 13146 TaxID=1121390 RepID=A0A1W1XXF6_9BACT|nr:50S ribosomal protein L10 [Desulfacinum hydrothermale]SMC28198.1 LSU ribosomal protein L10P [Desulfacinum hydrothermale DSM 13146]